MYFAAFSFNHLTKILGGRGGGPATDLWISFFSHLRLKNFAIFAKDWVLGLIWNMQKWSGEKTVAYVISMSTSEDDFKEQLPLKKKIKYNITALSIQVDLSSCGSRWNQATHFPQNPLFIDLSLRPLLSVL